MLVYQRVERDGCRYFWLDNASEGVSFCRCELETLVSFSGSLQLRCFLSFIHVATSLDSYPFH